MDNQKNSAGDIALSFNDEDTYLVIRDAGIRSEMLLAILNASGGASASSPNVLRLQNTDTTATGSTDAFLASKLTFKQDEYGQEICVVKSGDEEVGVMMGWETPIMEETVRALCPIDRPGLKVLNVGFGLGIVGLFFFSFTRRS